jgi:hypothetical protein
MNDKTGLSLILVVILAAAIVYFVFYYKKCPNCTSCPRCPTLPTKYLPTPQQTFPIGTQRAIVPDNCISSYSQLVLESLQPPLKKGQYLAAEGKCEVGDISPVNNYCENNGGLVAQFVSGTQDQDEMCAKTFGIGKSGQIYNMQQ